MSSNDHLFADTFENAGVGIALVDLEGKPYRTNKVFNEMIGYSPEELKSMSFDQFTHPQDALKDLKLFADLQAGKISKYSMEKRYITKSKSVIWALLNVSLVKDKITNETNYAIAIVQDITDRVLAKQKLENSNKQLDEFAYLSSHDLQQPLSNIKGFLDLFIDSYSEQFDEEGLDFLKLIDKSYRQLKEKLEAILEYSRIGRIDETTVSNLNIIIEEEWSKLSDLAAAKHATLEVDSIDFISVYPNEFRLLIHHLLKNALIFSSETCVPEIKIKVNRSAESLHFKVIDNGIGVPEKYYDRVFKMFQQLNDKSAYGGLGIGLSFSLKIIEHLNGKIWIDSVPNEYTIVNFTIPYKI